MSPSVGSIKREQHASPNPIPEKLSIKSGKKLHCRYWPAQLARTPRALVILIHGFGEHLGCYAQLGNLFSEQDILAFGHDHRGHGLSDGERAHVDSIDEYVTDVINHVHLMREEYPQIPIFAVAHSMGGLVLLTTCLKEPDIFNGVVLMGPLIFLNPTLSPPMITPVILWTVWLLGLIAPQFTVGSLKLDRITSDEAMKELIKNDPLIFKDGIKCKWASAVYSCLQELNRNLASMRVPFVTLHGEWDQLCDVRGSKLLFEVAQVQDKEIKIYPAAQHHLYRETPEIRREALMDTVTWITKRI